MFGDAHARFNLGCEENYAGNHDLALQHWMISAKLGDQKSLNKVKGFFMDGLACKDDYAGALRGYQNAMEEMSSPKAGDVLRRKTPSRIIRTASLAPRAGSLAPRAGSLAPRVGAVWHRA